MKVREFIEECMVKVFEAKAQAAVSHKKALPFRKAIDEIRLIGWKVNGDLDLMDVTVDTKELRFNHITGDQYLVINDNIVYNITNNEIYKTTGSFGVNGQFNKKPSRKTKLRVRQ